MSKLFDQINNFNRNVEFFYDVSKLKSKPDKEIRKHCQNLQIILIDGKDKDVDAIDLFEEHLILREIVNNNTMALQTLTLVKKLLGSLSNVEVVLRIFLTICINCFSRCRKKLFKIKIKNKI